MSALRRCLQKTSRQDPKTFRRTAECTVLPRCRGTAFWIWKKEPEELYRLLRSVDYGKSDIFPPLQTLVDGKCAEVLRYRKIAPEKRKDEENMLYLSLADGDLLKIKYRLKG